MKKIAIVIDDWKLSIFNRLLSEAGFAFDQKPGPANLILLFVKAKFASDIQKICEAAHAEARKSKLN